MAKPTIVTRAGKGSALTWTEGDTNLTNLRDATITVTDGTNSKAIDLNGSITFTAGTNVTLAVDSGTGAVTINSTASGATNLDGLTDVVITAAATDDILRFDGTNWVDTALSSITVGNASKLSNMPTMGYTTIITSNGTTTLTNTSNWYQVFTGTSNQTVVLPATNTLSVGWTFYIVNNSSGTLTIQASGGVSPAPTTIPAGCSVMAVVLDNTSGNPQSTKWECGLTNFSSFTGSGNLVFSTSPALTTPNLGTPSSIVLTNASGTASININGTVGATTPSTGAFTTLSASSTVSGTGFSTYLASPPAIGGTTAAAITGTTITANTQFSGSGAGLTSIPNSALTNSSITINGTAISLGGSTSVGTVTSVGGTGTVNGLSLSGTVTGSGSLTLGGTLDLSSPPAIGGTAAAAISATSLTFKDPREAIYDLGTTGGTIAPNVSNGSVQKITLNSALTINAFTSPVAGQSVTLIIYGGTAYTSITSTMKFAGGTKTLTATAGCIDILSIYYDGTNYFASLGKGYA